MPVFLRSCAEVAAIAAQEPFAGEGGRGVEGQAPGHDAGEEADRRRRARGPGAGHRRGRLAIEARELFWLPSGGTLESELDQKAIGKALGTGTQRTMGTIEQIAAKYCG